MKYPLFPFNSCHGVYHLDINNKYTITPYEKGIAIIINITGNILRIYSFIQDDSTFANFTKEEFEKQIEDFKNRYEFNLALKKSLGEDV